MDKDLYRFINFEMVQFYSKLITTFFKGYRHIILRNRANRPEGPASIFVKIKTSIYVPPPAEELQKHFIDPMKYKQDKQSSY